MNINVKLEDTLHKKALFMSSVANWLAFFIIPRSSHGTYFNVFSFFFKVSKINYTPEVIMGAQCESK